MSRMEYDPIARLRSEYETRRAKNPRYSLRAFSRQLKMSPGRVSELFSKKRQLTVAVANQIAEILKLSAEEEKLFLESVQARREPLTETITLHLNGKTELIHFKIELYVNGVLKGTLSSK